MQKKRILYIIGGLSRIGKTKIAEKMTERKRGFLIKLHTDRIRDSVKSIIRYGPQKTAPGDSREITFEFPTMCKQPTEKKSLTIKFTRNDGDEDAYGWLGVTNMINFYDQNNECDILVEGVAVEPKLIRELKLENLIIKGVFIGFGRDPIINESIIKSIVDYSTKEKDHFYIQHNGDSEAMKQDLENTVRSYIKNRSKFEKQVKECGCEHFDRTEHFEEDVQSVVNRLCG